MNSFSAATAGDAAEQMGVDVSIRSLDDSVVSPLKDEDAPEPPTGVDGESEFVRFTLLVMGAVGRTCDVGGETRLVASPCCCCCFLMCGGKGCGGVAGSGESCDDDSCDDDAAGAGA